MSSAFLESARIVVIGAGAVGSVIAYRLSQAGAEVTIVERKFPGLGTTGNSFAWLNSFGKTPREYHRLNVRSIREHQDLMRELDGDWLNVFGGIAWEEHHNSDRVARLKEKAKLLHQWGYRIEILSPERVMNELETDLFIDPDSVDEVYVAPIEGWVNGVGLCHGVVRGAVRRYGASIVQDDVVGFTQAQGVINEVTLASGSVLPADTVINAAGPDAASVAALAGIDLPITRQPGLLVVTRPAPVDVKHVIHTPEVNLRSDGGSRIMLHGEDFDEKGSSNDTVDVKDSFAQQAVQRAAKVVPGLTGMRAEAVRIGIRPMPKDGHPIIGFDPDVGGYYHAVMHSGVTLCAAVGALIAEGFMGSEPPELEPYRKERFTVKETLPFHATNE